MSSFLGAFPVDLSNNYSDVVMKKPDGTYFLNASNIANSLKLNGDLLVDGDIHFTTQNNLSVP